MASIRPNVPSASQSKEASVDPTLSKEDRRHLERALTQAVLAVPDELCDIPDDVYSMFFLS